MTDAQRPAKLSAPTCSNSSTKDAVEALPEKGRVSKRGNNSAGTPIVPKRGERKLESSSIAPDAFNIETPTMSAQSVGKRLIAVCSPCFAPVKKDSKRSCFANKSRMPTMPRMSGIGRAETISIIVF